MRFAVVIPQLTGAKPGHVTFRGAAGLAALLAAMEGGPDRHAAASGWTEFAPAADARIVYVSSTVGDDASGRPHAPGDPEIGLDPFDPAGPIRPYRTVAAATGRLRDGMPDWMLLRRGDAWTESLGHWTKSGRSPAEPMLVGAWGTAPDRPQLLTGSRDGFVTFNVRAVNDLAIAGLSFTPHARQPHQGPTGLLWLVPTDGFLVEDCSFSGYKDNVVIHPYPAAGAIRNVRIRRCIIADAWSAGRTGHSQGLYADGVDGILIEENVFDHNGWNEAVRGAWPTVYNHNIYLQNGTRNAVLRGNIISNGSNHGAQVRGGGVVEGNLFVRNVVALLLGGGDAPTPGGITATAVGNAILEGRGGATFPAGYGIDLKNIAGALIQGNVLANKLSDSDAFAIGSYVSGGPAGVGVNDTQIRDNVICNWRGPIRLTGSACTGVVVAGNVVRDTGGATKAGLVDAPSVDPAAIVFSGNTYSSASASHKWFRVRGVERSFAWWQSSVEPGAAQELVAPRAAVPTIGGYAATLGLPATHEAFIAEARRQARHNWRPEYTAAAVIDLLCGQGQRKD